MKRKGFSFLFICSFFALLNLCYSDLPIHCLKHQVVGQWKLQITEPQLVQKPYRMNCGHENPDNPANSYLALRGQFKPFHEFKVSLNNQDKVIGDRGTEIGSWTMVYDEGFQILVNNQRFTSFFDYFLDDNDKVMSYCGRTVVGWYRDLKSGQEACFKAEKILKSSSEEAGLYGKPTEQIRIDKPSDSLNFLQMALGAREIKLMEPGLKRVFHKDFNDFKFFVEKLNQIPGKRWEAKVYPRFEGKTLAELNKFAGRRKYGFESYREPKPASFIQSSDLSGFPKNFTWKNLLKKVREQGDCGSCFAFATIEMLEARLLLKHNKNVSLSVQHVLDCSFENQGCDGGFPFLVGKFANEVELVPESCSPYKETKGSCQACDVTKLDEVYKVDNYGYIGGAFGKSNEASIMKELRDNGPLVANIDAESDLVSYGGGIYSYVNDGWMKLGLEKPEWQQVTHSVLVYGWGETEDGQKYWEILNSWGEDWGENGSFRMVRGTDECALESNGEFAHPVIVKRNIGL